MREATHRGGHRARSRWIARLAGGLIALACATSCRGDRSRSEKLVVADFASPAIALVFIAEQHGFFADEGLAVELAHFDLGRDALDAMLEGRADVAMAYLTPVALRAFDDSRLRILTSLHHSHENTAVVARRDRRIASAADLRGRRVGLPRGTSAELFLEVLLSLNAVSPREVEVVDLPPDRLADALQAGEVDAVAMNSPYRERARRRLGEGALELTSKVYVEMTVLLTREDHLRSRRGAIGKMLRALARAERLAEERPREAVEVLQRRFPTESAEELETQWAQIVPHLGLHNVLLTALDREAAFLRARRGISRPPPDFRHLVAAGPLFEVIPEAVTLAPRSMEKALSNP
jgi:ABC-type nitrate/sulfonate/bicarbonate transport system substrate-binding protein